MAEGVFWTNCVPSTLKCFCFITQFLQDVSLLTEDIGQAKPQKQQALGHSENYVTIQLFTVAP